MGYAAGTETVITAACCSCVAALQVASVGCEGRVRTSAGYRSASQSDLHVWLSPAPPLPKSPLPRALHHLSLPDRSPAYSMHARSKCVGRGNHAHNVRKCGAAMLLQWHEMHKHLCTMKHLPRAVLVVQSCSTSTLIYGGKSFIQVVSCCGNGDSNSGHRRHKPGF